MLARQRSEGVGVDALLCIGMTFLLLLTRTAGSPSASNPALKIRVSRAGLDYIAGGAVAALSERVKGFEIRDRKNSTYVSIGRVDYEITDIKVTDFVDPSSSVVLNPRRGLSWQLTGPVDGLSLHGNWTYRYRRRTGRFSRQGSFNASMQVAIITLDVSVSTDASTGRPTVTAGNCSCAINAPARITVHGSAAVWLHNLFAGSVQRSLKAELQRLVCDAARRAVDVDIRSEVDKLQIRIPVGESWLFDYRLVDRPRLDPDFIEFSHEGTFVHKSDTSQPPFQAEPFPAVKSQRMVTIWLSDYTAQLIGYVLHRQGVLRLHMSRDLLPDSAKDFLNTTCRGGFCLGSLLPQVSQAFPNAFIDLELGSSSPPRVEISQQSIQGTFFGLVGFSARLSNGTVVPLIRTNVNISVDIAVSLVDSVLRGNVSNLVPSVSVLDSDIGTVSAPLLQSILQTTVGGFVLPLLRNLAWSGLPLPSFRGVKLVEPRIEMHPHCLIITTDFRCVSRSRA